MNSKFIKAIVFTIALFFSGNISLFLGIYKGFEWAVEFSKPRNSSGWTTPQEMIAAFKYCPVVLGGSLIILSIIFSTILFHTWAKRSLEN